MTTSSADSYTTLLRDAFNAATPRERARLTTAYYDLLRARAKTPTLLQNLLNLSAKTKTIGTKHQLSNTSSGRSACLASMPNEVLDRIFDFTLCDVDGNPRDIDNIPYLVVCHRLRDFCLRHILSNQLFEFASSKRDGYYYCFRTEARRPPRLPTYTFADSYYVAYPEPSRFKQTSGLLALRSLVDSLSTWFLPDPMSHVRRIHIDVHIPPLQRLQQDLTNPAWRGFSTDRVTHPYLLPKATKDDVVRWRTSDITPSRAAYHMGFLTKLPFKNLHTLELSFGGFTVDNTIEDSWVLTLWIGRYLHSIRVKDMARKVIVRDKESRFMRMMEVIIHEGMAEAPGNSWH